MPKRMATTPTQVAQRAPMRCSRSIGRGRGSSDAAADGAPTSTGSIGAADPEGEDGVPVSSAPTRPALTRFPGLIAPLELPQPYYDLGRMVCYH
jgi:hypothetical protein